ncbi:MAG: metal ABC transporter substrate-binding protein [Eubacteriales bacterium]
MKIKKLISIFLSVSVFACMFAGCSNKNNGKFNVVCSLFPQYDFVREIAGNKVNLRLMLVGGVDAHDFEPLSEEMSIAKSADLFIYTGDYMELWVAKRMKDAKKTQDYIFDASTGITLDIDMASQEIAGQTGNGENAPLFDPHFWTNPLNAIKMVDTITTRLCLMDTVNADFYKANATAYKLKLEALDKGFKDTVQNGKRKNIVIGDSFALSYFTKAYGLGYLATQNTCFPVTEPSESVLARLENAIIKGNVPVIFYRDNSDQKTAKLLSEKTGAQMLLFHSCENLSKEELKAGATYLSLMQQNLKNLKTALG